MTDRCPFRCLYCTPAEGVEEFTAGEILEDDEIVRFVRLIGAHFGLAKVHITGGEALGRRGIAKLVAMLAGEGVEDLAMTTNGQRLGELAGDLKQAGLKRVNISLPTLNPRTFRRLTGGGKLADTLEGVEAALRAGLAPVKWNVTVLRGVNDHEVGDIALAGIDRGVEVRFIELMPIGPAAQRHREWFVSAAEVLDCLRERFQLRPRWRPRGSSTREFQATSEAGKQGVVGVIASMTQPFCAGCNRLRLSAGGELVGCLREASRESILPLLRTHGPLDEGRILEKVLAALGQKLTGRGFQGDHCMVKTGG